ncbi:MULTISPECIES: hypothetical protein [unclassified Leptolyngbya]|nr:MULTISPECIES: hypothetical protein [unclassified Leptolyngbya]
MEWGSSMVDWRVRWGIGKTQPTAKTQKAEGRGALQPSLFLVFPE